MKTYGLQFGSGDARLNTGLSPTMILVYDMLSGATMSGYTILEFFPGSGIYQFTAGVTGPVFFLADGGAVLSSQDRFVDGILDPIQSVDEKMGTLTDSFGSTSVDPGTVLGYLKRSLEFWEGNANFNKQNGVWDIYSRGSTTLLREKTLTNTISAATKA